MRLGSDASMQRLGTTGDDKPHEPLRSSSPRSHRSVRSTVRARTSPPDHRLTSCVTPVRSWDTPSTAVHDKERPWPTRRTSSPTTSTCWSTSTRTSRRCSVWVCSCLSRPPCAPGVRCGRRQRLGRGGAHPPADHARRRLARRPGAVPRQARPLAHDTLRHHRSARHVPQGRLHPLGHRHPDPPHQLRAVPPRTSSTACSAPAHSSSSRPPTTRSSSTTSLAWRGCTHCSTHGSRTPSTGTTRRHRHADPPGASGAAARKIERTGPPGPPASPRS